MGWSSLPHLIGDKTMFSFVPLPDGDRPLKKRTTRFNTGLVASLLGQILGCSSHTVRMGRVAGSFQRPLWMIPLGSARQGRLETGEVGLRRPPLCCHKSSPTICWVLRCWKPPRPGQPWEMLLGLPGESADTVRSGQHPQGWAALSLLPASGG